MATFTWTAQGTDGSTNQVMGATDKLAFYATTYGNAITVSSYQDSTHTENSTGTHLCTTVHIHNVKYVDSTHYILDGGASTLLAAGAPTTAQASLLLNFANASSVATSSAKFWAYDGTTDTAVPTNVTVQIAEQANTTWTAASGRAAACTLAAQSAATSHNFYINISVSPTAVGDLTAFAFKAELTYQ